ncbi:hypothetical protein Mesci_5400 [Mesorhizobium ciceri biovar biserrulae WSM1271]|uniref:Uncharacterized protein n=1 Tax=Mesorhizobium ciceri biovar biserrulae (strain HAMBI 2942 / LMG 23838 / WSM1271) TaxID=765698 RepID=E8TDD2_MESCW|nr:hypothetical protein Mesci_5400 [Mesorhizobium ciceri biovar biserrulae WSM1271]
MPRSGADASHPQGDFKGDFTFVANYLVIVVPQVAPDKQKEFLDSLIGHLGPEPEKFLIGGR